MLKSTVQSQTTSFPATVHRLDNGLTIIHQNLAVTPVVVVDVWVKAGAIEEPDEWLGMAHFLEHMIFKGTKNIPPGLFDYLIENSGGMTNAATGQDYAHFYLTARADEIEHTLPLLGEILLEAIVDDEEFYLEKEVVLEELRACQDDPDWIAYNALCENLYREHPYGRSILGDEASLARLTPNQMRCFHRTHYQPENMTVVIVGGIELEPALEIVKTSFSRFPVRSESPPHLIAAEPPPIGIRRSELCLDRLDSARLLMGWTAGGIDNIEDAFGLDLLSVILAGGKCSRLVRHLREEEQLVSDVDSSFSLQRDSSLFTIGARLHPDLISQVENAIRSHISLLQDYPVSTEELERGQRSLCNDYIFSTETPGQLAGLYGYYQTLKSPEISVIYPDIIRRFNPDDLRRLARQYLSPEHYAITILKK